VRHGPLQENDRNFRDCADRDGGRLGRTAKRIDRAGARRDGEPLPDT
jgi:hypothetical protein